MLEFFIKKKCACACAGVGVFVFVFSLRLHLQVRGLLLLVRVHSLRKNWYAYNLDLLNSFYVCLQFRLIEQFL